MENALGNVLETFNGVTDWLTGSLGSVTDLFYNSTDGLTFLGVMAIGALGISVSMLVINVVKSFIRFQ